MGRSVGGGPGFGDECARHITQGTRPRPAGRSVTAGSPSRLRPELRRPDARSPGTQGLGSKGPVSAWAGHTVLEPVDGSSQSECIPVTSTPEALLCTPQTPDSTPPGKVARARPRSHVPAPPHHPPAVPHSELLVLIFFPGTSRSRGGRGPCALLARRPRRWAVRPPCPATLPSVPSVAA